MHLFMLLALYVFSLLVGFSLFMLSMLMSNKVKGVNKLTTFECGFSAVGPVHSPFSIHFFNVLVMFVIFDLEIVLLLGCVMSGVFGLFVFILLMLFMVGGLYLEWYLGKLSWLV